MVAASVLSVDREYVSNAFGGGKPPPDGGLKAGKPILLWNGGSLHKPSIGNFAPCVTILCEQSAQ